MSKQHFAAQAFEPGPRPPITLNPVESNLIADIGYNADIKTLAVTFKRKDGPPIAVYHYPDIPYDGADPSFMRFAGAESLGKYHGQHIKQLPFKKYHPDRAPEAEAVDERAAA